MPRQSAPKAVTDPSGPELGYGLPAQEKRLVDWERRQREERQKVADLRAALDATATPEMPDQERERRECLARLAVGGATWVRAGVM